MRPQRINTIARRRYRAIVALLIGCSVFGSIYMLHREVMTLKMAMLSDHPGFVTIGHPDIPTCNLRFEVNSAEMQAMNDERIWAVLHICARQHRQQHNPVPPGLPI